jgi:hypothetical protein
MKNIIIIFLSIGLIAMLLMMMKTGSILKTPETPTGILNIEFAKDTADIKRILKAWERVKSEGKTVVEAAKTNTYWDFVFIFFYAGFFFYGNTLLSEKFRGRFIKICEWASVAALFAGFLDCCENGLILTSLSGKFSPTIVSLTKIFAILKFTLITFSIVTFVIMFSLRLAGFGKKLNLN